MTPSENIATEQYNSRWSDDTLFGLLWAGTPNVASDAIIQEKLACVIYLFIHFDIYQLFCDLVAMTHKQMSMIFDGDELSISEMGDESEDFSRAHGTVLKPVDLAYLIDQEQLRTSELKQIWRIAFGDLEVTDRRIKLFWKAFWAEKFTHYDDLIPYRAYPEDQDPLNGFAPIQPIFREQSSAKQAPLDPTPLFKTTKTNGESVVQTDTFGTGSDERPVLKYSSRFRRNAKQVAQALILQHALATDDVCSDGTHLVSADIQRTVISELGDDGWVSFKNSSYDDQMPISRRQPLDGIWYIMFTRSDESHTPDNIPVEDVPRYIGIAERDPSGSGSLNSGFTQIKSDMSKASASMARWGYGTADHLGALSKACFADPMDYEAKYKRWADALFKDGEKKLKRPVYVELLPWFDRDVETSETNAIMQASYIYGDKLLNDKDTTFKKSEFSIEGE